MSKLATSDLIKNINYSNGGNMLEEFQEEIC